MNKESFTIELKLDWSEMDLFGHINNVSYFKYIQASRVNCWEVIGLSKMFKTDLLGPTLASTTCRFVKPLHYPGKIFVQTVITFVKNSSFGLKHIIKNEEGLVCAEGEDVIVFFDYKINQKAELPAKFKELFQKIVSEN